MAMTTLILLVWSPSTYLRRRQITWKGVWPASIGMSKRWKPIRIKLIRTTYWRSNGFLSCQLVVGKGLINHPFGNFPPSLRYVILNCPRVNMIRVEFHTMCEILRNSFISNFWISLFLLSRIGKESIELRGMWRFYRNQLTQPVALYFAERQSCLVRPGLNGELTTIRYQNHAVDVGPCPRCQKQYSTCNILYILVSKVEMRDGWCD